MAGSVTVTHTGNGTATGTLVSSREVVEPDYPGEQGVSKPLPGTYSYQTWSFEAVPDSGWVFAGWKRKVTMDTSIWGTLVYGPDDLEESAAFSTELLMDGSGPEYGNWWQNNAWEYQAVFEQVQNFTISTSANPGGGGTTAGGGTYSTGATCMISATAASGYHFVKWVCSDGREITDASYTFAVSASLTFTAQFEEGTGLPLCDGTSGEIMFGKNGEILFDG